MREAVKEDVAGTMSSLKAKIEQGGPRRELILRAIVSEAQDAAAAALGRWGDASFGERELGRAIAFGVALAAIDLDLDEIITLEVLKELVDGTRPHSG